MIRTFYNVCQHRPHQLISRSGSTRLAVCPYHARTYELTGKLRAGPTLKPLEWVPIPENCNWKVSVENYSECYHCGVNHPTFATGIVKPETYDIQAQGYCLRHTTEYQNLENMTYQIDSSQDHAEVYSSWSLWPMFLFQVYPGNILNTYHWRVIDGDHVVVWRG